MVGGSFEEGARAADQQRGCCFRTSRRAAAAKADGAGRRPRGCSAVATAAVGTSRRPLAAPSRPSSVLLLFQISLVLATILLLLFPGKVFVRAFSVVPAPLPPSLPRHRSVAARRPCSSSSTCSTRLYFFFGNDNNNKNNWFGPTTPNDETESMSSRTSSSSPPTSANNSNTNVVDDEPDFIEKIFGVFFGAKEESPMGLKRFGRERFPEQYPATVSEWADPVVGDDKDVAILRPLLKNTNLEFRALRLAYSANRDGWNAPAFHAKVDKQGPSLVVATTSGDNLVVGGYNPKGWVSYGEARGSIAAFLFVKNRRSGDAWTKLRKVGGPSLAQLDYPESGPSFGADSLVIPLAGSDPRRARSKLGSYYERFEDGTNSLFGPGRASATLSDLKVYQGVYGPDEYIPFTDAEPFALY